jgi:tRNA nucleotidyltransferase (CCA-adding enzyme)
MRVYVVMRIRVDDLPDSVVRVTSVINTGCGGMALLVGGAVRDKLMGKLSKDYDIEVYGLHPDLLEKELRKVYKVDAVGKSFGVLKVSIDGEDLDVSVPRRESKSGRGHKGFILVPDPSMTIEEAARRRDFTVNAILMEPRTGKIFDPYNGVEDIKNQVLRAVDPRAFVEDPLRILRGAQFAARFQLAVEPHTLLLMQQASSELVELPKERIGAEWHKLLMKSEKPSTGLEVMKQAGVLRVLHPELDVLSETPQDGEWHPEGDVWVHTKMVVDVAAAITEGLPLETKEVVMYAALFHDIGKPETTTHDDDGHIRSLKHEEVGGRIVDELLHENYDVPKDTVEKVVRLVADHLKPSTFYKHGSKASAVRRLSKRIAPATIEELVLVARADHGGRLTPGADTFPAGDWVLEKASEMAVVREPPKSLLLGRHLIALGVKPGPRMGEILKQVEELQLDGRVTNLDEAIAAAREIIALRL